MKVKDKADITKMSLLSWYFFLSSLFIMSFFGYIFTFRYLHHKIFTSLNPYYYEILYDIWEEIMGEMTERIPFLVISYYINIYYILILNF